jgi:hypothetical protein
MQLLDMIGDHPVTLANIKYYVAAVVVIFVVKVNKVRSHNNNRSIVARISKGIDGTFGKVIDGFVCKLACFCVSQQRICLF